MGDDLRQSVGPDFGGGVLLLGEHRDAGRVVGRAFDAVQRGFVPQFGAQRFEHGDRHVVGVVVVVVVYVFQGGADGI